MGCSASRKKKKPKFHDKLQSEVCVTHMMFLALTCTITVHFKINMDCFLTSKRQNPECLFPVIWIFWTTENFDLHDELNFLSNHKLITFAGFFYFCRWTLARGVIFNLNVLRSIMMHIN